MKVKNKALKNCIEPAAMFESVSALYAEYYQII